MDNIIWQDDVAWAARNEHWSAFRAKPRRYRAKRERSREPLVLCGHGVSLKVEKGALAIRDGFTHWPQERTEYRLFKGAHDLPPRIVMLDGSGSLSFDVMDWLSSQNIPLIRVDYQGHVLSVIGGAGFSTDPLKLQWQIDTRADPVRRLAFCCNLIEAKLTTSLRTLREALPDSPARMIALNRIPASLQQIRSGAVSSVEELRMVEAVSAAAYFNAWQGAPLQWRTTKKRPIPDRWRTIGARGSTTATGGRASNRNAKHPVNAVLNYAYGMLSSQVHIEAVASGYDPRRGIMHHDRDEQSALAWVFDMIEPRRAEMDAKVLKFMLRTSFTGADFVIRSDGVCRLNPQLARKVAELAS
jgi:CRISPR-associated endonuclease Cas1